MPLARSYLAVFLLCTSLLSACSVLGLDRNQAGVRITSKQDFCGSPSQSSDVHYFASQAAFDNWVAYRDIGHWNEKVRPPGLAIVEMGQRPTGGYKLRIINDQTRIENNTLTIAIDWHAPRSDAAVSQAMTTQCVAVALPKGQYNHVDVVDQVGNPRGAFDVATSNNTGKGA